MNTLREELVASVTAQNNRIYAVEKLVITRTVDKPWTRLELEQGITYRSYNVYNNDEAQISEHIAKFKREYTREVYPQIDLGSILSMYDHVVADAVDVPVDSGWIGVVCNKTNWAAKTEGPEFYDLKVELLLILAKYPELAWTDNDIVYVETPVGQVSFHQPPWSTVEVLEEKGLTPTEWSGVPTQEISHELMVEYVEEHTWRGYANLLV